MIPEHKPATFADGVALIAAERKRQVEAEGWTPEHDDQHKDGEMIRAAICYAIGAPYRWPWEAGWWKPKDRITDLVRAGALIAAEIDRLQRAALREPEPAASAYLRGAKDLAERLKADYMRTTESINRWIDAVLAEMEASHGRAPEGLTPGGLRGHVHFECETREDYKDDE